MQWTRQSTNSVTSFPLRTQRTDCPNLTTTPNDIIPYSVQQPTKALPNDRILTSDNGKISLGKQQRGREGHIGMRRLPIAERKIPPASAHKVPQKCPQANSSISTTPAYSKKSTCTRSVSVSRNADTQSHTTRGGHHATSIRPFKPRQRACSTARAPACLSTHNEANTPLKSRSPRLLSTTMAIANTVAPTSKEIRQPAELSKRNPIQVQSSSESQCSARRCRRSREERKGREKRTTLSIEQSEQSDKKAHTATLDMKQIDCDNIPEDRKEEVIVIKLIQPRPVAPPLSASAVGPAPPISRGQLKQAQRKQHSAVKLKPTSNKEHKVPERNKKMLQFQARRYLQELYANVLKKLRERSTPKRAASRLHRPSATTRPKTPTVHRPIAAVKPGEQFKPLLNTKMSILEFYRIQDQAARIIQHGYRKHRSSPISSLS